MVDGLGRSNNPNKLSPQEPIHFMMILKNGSNNTNKLSPQEQSGLINKFGLRSNNTNKLSPQEPNQPPTLTH